MAKLPRAAHADRIRLPKEVRAQNLGVTPLLPGEVSANLRIRAPKGVIEQLEAMTPQERGELVARALVARRRERL